MNFRISKILLWNAGERETTEKIYFTHKLCWSLGSNCYSSSKISVLMDSVERSPFGTHSDFFRIAKDYTLYHVQDTLYTIHKQKTNFLNTHLFDLSAELLSLIIRRLLLVARWTAVYWSITAGYGARASVNWA